jgi:hypothetical protein
MNRGGRLRGDARRERAMLVADTLLMSMACAPAST